MKPPILFLLVFIFHFPFSIFHSANAQRINVSTDSVIITGPYVDAEPKIFTQRRTEYTPDIKKFGLQFRNGLRNVLTQTITGTDQNASPIIGASGPGTVVELNGVVNIDNGGAKPSLYVGNGGRIKFGPQAQVDLILQNSYFTRQFWIMGDGTGTVELDSNFVADLTQGGTISKGLGSIRLSACTLETKSSLSLPMGYRPWPNEANAQAGRSKINSHLVFENAPGSVWHVTGDQDYKGGLWVRKDMEVNVDLRKTLTLSGDTTTWSDYTNYGGIYLQDTGITISKTGRGNLILSGRHGYSPNSFLYIEDGSVFMRNNPGKVTDSIFNPIRQNIKHRDNLSIYCGRGANLYFTPTLDNQTDSFNISSLTSLGAVQVQAGKPVVAGQAINLGNELNIYFPSPVQIGDTIHLFKAPVLNVGPNQITTIGLNQNLRIDNSRLGAFGEIIITGINATQPKLLTLPIYPNPAHTHITLPTPNAGAQPFLVDVQGKIYPLSRQFGNRFLLPAAAKGLYMVMVEGYAPTRLLVE